MLAYPRKLCSICRQPLTVHRVVHGYCEAPTCRVAVGQRRVAERQADERAALQSAADAYRQVVLDTRPDLQMRGVDVVPVPGFGATMQPVSQSRRDTLRVHIDELLSEESLVVESAIEQADELTPRAQQVTAAGCSTCRGFCCRRGGDSAYIKADTIARIRQTHSSLTSDALAAVYLNAVPDVGAVGSCIFHGEQGCTLPRDFRADICNQYFCGPLTTWLERAGQNTEAAVALIVVEGTVVVRSNLIDR